MPSSDVIEIKKQVLESISVKQLLTGTEYLSLIAECAALITEAFKKGSKLLICGNGGSAADAQHIAAEFTARFEAERMALPAIALNANSSILTAVGNDYAYDMVFARQIEAYGLPRDILLAISASGNSENIRFAMERAKSKSLYVIALLGNGGGKCFELADKAIVIPSERTSRIQEAHIMVGHILCFLVEKEFINEYKTVFLDRERGYKL